MITVPDIIVKPFADSGDVQMPPQTSSGGFVNFTDGYTSFYEISLTANNPQAKAVERQVQNYMFNALTKNAKAWQSAGLPVWYASMPGGYSANAWVLRQGGDNIWRPFRALVDGTVADPLTSTDWEYVQLSSEMIKNIPMPSGGLRGPTTAIITVASDFNTFRNGTWQIVNDAIAGACPNVPVFPNQETVASAGLIEAITWSNGSQSVTIQRYTNRNGAVATRSGLNGSFAPWVYQLSFVSFQNGYGVLAATNGTTSPSANAYAAFTVPLFSAVADGCEIRTTWGAGTIANTGPSTFNLNGTGAFNILAVNALPLQGGEILPGGGMTLRFRNGVGWMVMSIWQGNFPVMSATQSRHATPFAQVQQMINDAKITQVDWSNVVNKPNVVINRNAGILTSLSLSSPTPYLDFYFAGNETLAPSRIMNTAQNALAFFTDTTSNATVMPLYIDSNKVLTSKVLQTGGGVQVPAGQSVSFISSDYSANRYSTAHDTNTWNFNIWNDASPQVASTPIAVARSSGQVFLTQRPVFAGQSPWDTGNFNPNNYRQYTDNAFNAQIQSNSSLSIKTGAPVFFTDAANATSWYTFNHDTTNFNFTTSTGANAYSVAKATGLVSFGSRPLFAGKVPWDNGNFTPSSYRLYTDNAFNAQIQSNSSMVIKTGAPVYFADAANAVSWYTISHDVSNFYFATNAGFTAYSVARATGAVSFGSRPSFAGQTPWDTGNFNPNVYAGLNVNNQAWMGVVSVDTANMASLNGQTGGLRVGTGASQPGRSACINFLRDSFYGTYIGLDTDNVMKIGGWSYGATATPILTVDNLPTWLPGALTSIGVGGIGSYGLFCAYALASPNGPGGTVPGANLRYSATDGYAQAQTASGTWRMMGQIGDADGQSPNSVTLYQRIA